MKIGSIRAIWLLVMVLIAAFGFPGAASAAGESYFVAWRVVPQELSSASQWVKPYTAITGARLLPYKLYVVDADIVGADGKTVMAAGSELIGLVSKAKIGCTITPPVNKGLNAVIFVGVARYVCLLDADADGHFDHYFRSGTPTVGIFAGSGRVPAILFDIRPAAYAERPPETATTPPKVYLQYGWFASFVNELVFQLCLKENTTGNDGTCLSPDFSVKRTGLPATFEALGGTFRVDAKKDNMVQVTMLAPFKAQPLFLSY